MAEDTDTATPTTPTTPTTTSQTTPEVAAAPTPEHAPIVPAAGPHVPVHDPTTIPTPPATLSIPDITKAVAEGVAQGISRQQTTKDRVLGRSVATTEQLLEAKYATNADGTPLTPQQQLAIDREIETRHQEDLVAASQAATHRASAVASVSAQFPEMADSASPLYQAVAELAQMDPMSLHPKALLIATKAAALDLGLQPVAKRANAQTTQARADVVQQIQAAQAAGQVTPKGTGGAGPAVSGAEPSYSTMNYRELEAEVSRRRGH